MNDIRPVFNIGSCEKIMDKQCVFHSIHFNNEETILSYRNEIITNRSESELVLL